MNTAPQLNQIPPPAMELDSEDRVELCAQALDKTLLAPSPEAALTFLMQWGEALRLYLLSQQEDVFSDGDPY